MANDDDTPLPADFEQRYGFIHADHSGVDLAKLRRHHRKLIHDLKRSIRRQSELEAEVDRLRLLEDQRAALEHGIRDRVASLEAEAEALRALLIETERQTIRQSTRGRRLVSVPIVLDRPDRGLGSAA